MTSSPGAHRGGRRHDTDDPHRSRARALSILFQSDVRGVDPLDVLARLRSDPDALSTLDEEGDLDPIDGFTEILVRGVHAHREQIDELVGRFARGWQVHRMPVVDRNLLRLATYELAHEATTPAIVIDEAIEFAKSLSTKDSGRYVNGVLEAVRRHLAEG